MATKGVPVPRRATVAAEPVRTCIGCRRRDVRSALLRVVVDVTADGSHTAAADPARVRPGRGASLHPDPQCLAQAVKRRAFGRALRVDGAVDVSEVTAVLRQAAQNQPAQERAAQAAPNAENRPNPRAGRQVMNTP